MDFKNMGKGKASPGGSVRVSKAAGLWFSFSLDDFLGHSLMAAVPWALLSLDGGERGHVLGMQGDKVPPWVGMLTSSSAEVLGAGRRGWS